MSEGLLFVPSLLFSDRSHYVAWADLESTEHPPGITDLHHLPGSSNLLRVTWLPKRYLKGNKLQTRGLILTDASKQTNQKPSKFPSFTNIGIEASNCTMANVKTYESELLPVTECAGTLILASPTSRTMRKKFLFCINKDKTKPIVIHPWLPVPYSLQAITDLVTPSVQFCQVARDVMMSAW